MKSVLEQPRNVGINMAANNNCLQFDLKTQRSNEHWSNQHCLFAVLATGFASYFNAASLLVIFFSTSFTLLWAYNWRTLANFKYFAGGANWITFSRFCIISLVMVMAQQLPLWVTATLVAVAVLLDVADGIYAKLTQQTSDFGAMFDMEVDAFFVLAMGFYFYNLEGFGLWVLFPGLLRYLYRLAVMAFADKDFKETRKSYAVFLAGLNFFLLALAVPLPTDVSFWLLVASCIVAGSSFAKGFVELYQYAKS